jgi:hypothetical protein
MIPPIRDAWRARFSQPRPFAFSRGAKYFFTCIPLLLIVGICLIHAAPLQASQDSSAKPVPVPAAQVPPAGSSNSWPRAASESTPLQKAVHQKKVITEDDLAKPAKSISLSDLDGEENNPACDLSCEAELRVEMGFGPEREAEFRNQLTLARHEISDDRVWTSTLEDALQAASGYCDIQRQIEKIVGKGAVSEYTRNDVHSRFAERQGKLKSQYRNSTGLLTQRVQAVQRFAPFRATVMQYQWNEATARVCPGYPLP